MDNDVTDILADIFASDDAGADVPEAIASFIDVIDCEPKLPVISGRISNPTASVDIFFQERKCLEYHVNWYTLERFSGAPLERALYWAIYGVRMRVQIENPDLELFPSLDPTIAGRYKAQIEMDLQTEKPLEVSDRELVAKIGCHSYRVASNSALPIVKKMVTEDASKICERTKRR